jgi:hypothetical protein
MNSISKKQLADLDRKSEVRQKEPGKLRLVEDIRHVHPDLLDRVRQAVNKARHDIEGVIANENGQGLLFPYLNEDEIEVSEEYADEVIKRAEADLGETGIKLQKTPDSIRVMAKWEKDEEDGPASDQGH